MIEQKVAMNLVKRAVEKFNKTHEFEYPVLPISKRYYKRYNFDILKNELGRLNFKCVDQTNSPKPFCDMKDAFKNWLIYQPNCK